MDHVCLSIRCDDLKRLADDLRARGVRLEGDVVRRYGDGPSLYLRDPDDYVVELKPRSRRRRRYSFNASRAMIPTS
jgi:hypothetical protein